MASPLPKRSSELENEQSGAYEAVASAQPIDQPEYEYDFVEQPSQDFYCPVSFELLRDPQQTTCCGKHLSQEAAERLQREGKPCPMCKEANLTTMPDKFYMRKVNELLVRCPHECKWVGSLSDFNQHCNSCPKRPWVCEYCHFRATYEVGVNNHLPNCTKYPEPCPNHCDIGTVERCNLENHLQECPLQLVECEAGCSARVPRRDLGRHMEESVQQHLVAMSLRLHQKMEEITELREQLDQQGRQLQKQGDETAQELKKQLQQHKGQIWTSPQIIWTFALVIVALGLFFSLNQKLDDLRDEHLQALKSKQGRHAKAMQNLTEKTESLRKEFKQHQAVLDQSVTKLRGEQAQQQQNTEARMNHLEQEQGQMKREEEELKREMELNKQEFGRSFDVLHQRTGIVPVLILMTDFAQHERDNDNWYSEPFYSHLGGYEMCLSVNANGNGEGKGTHVSVFVCLMRGKYDNSLKWPFRDEITIQLLNQLEDGEHHTVTIAFTEQTPDTFAGRVTEGETGNGWGRSLFIPLTALGKYLMNDSLRFRVSHVKRIS